MVRVWKQFAFRLSFLYCSNIKVINISAYLLGQYIVNFQSNELLLARLQAYKYNIREKGRANFMADVGKMIKKLREEANMTQDNLAEK